MRKIIGIIGVLIITSLMVTINSCGSVKEYASTSQPIGHVIWDGLLKKHVTEAGKVDYQGFIRDSISFNRYLDLLQAHHPNKLNWSRDEQLAYWLNAYNAFTVKLIIDHYPVKSIKDIKNGIPFVNTVWDIKFIQIEGANYDLNNIEHGIIRPRFKEPRIHFAANCASISCPRLRNEAYTAKQLDEQLTDQVRYFLNSTPKNELDEYKPKLSKLFSWYRSDFGDVIKFINTYADVKINKDADLEYLDYNWSLNE